jgi:hypothetical protein
LYPSGTCYFLEVRNKHVVVALGISALFCAAACSVVADFSALTGPAVDAAPGDTGVADAGSADAIVAATQDASDAASNVDAGATDAVADVAVDAGCPADMGGPSCDYALVYSMIMPAGGTWTNLAAVPWAEDRTATTGAFTRVAYRLALDAEDVWIEMDAFTSDPTKLGVPMEWVFDVDVTNVLVYSTSANQQNIVTKTTGHVELWSNCYDGQDGGNDFNGLDVIAASMPHCYGTMEITVGKLPVLSFHRWANTDNNNIFDVGIGVAMAPDQADWTFSQNAGNFSSRRLEVYVR